MMEISGGVLCTNVSVVVLACAVWFTAAEPTVGRKIDCSVQPPKNYPTCLPNTSAYAAIVLNRMFASFDPENDDSLLGVTAWMAPTASLTDDIWCYPEFTPNESRSSCQEDTGHTANCRFSASLYSHNISLDYDSKTNKTLNRVSFAEYRDYGIAFNQQLVEQNMAKCVYAFDGTSVGRWNSGCGAPTCSCSNGCYEDLCCSNVQPSAPKVCAVNDQVACGTNPWSASITSSMCKVADQSMSTYIPPANQPSGLPEKASDSQCFWNMPNLIYQKTDPKGVDNMRAMMKWRTAHQEGMDLNTNNPSPQHGTSYTKVQSEWTEVVLDARSLLTNLKTNAPNTVIAFIFGQNASGQPVGNPGVSQISATAAQKSYCENYDCSEYMPPLVMWDRNQMDFTQNTKYGCGPFYPPTVAPQEGNDRCSEDDIYMTVPTPSPTSSPTPSPTSSPTMSPTQSPTLAPTAPPTPSPTAPVSHAAAYVVPLVVVGIVLLVLVILGFLFWGRQAGVQAVGAPAATEMGTTA